MAKAPVTWTDEQKANLSLALKAEAAARKTILAKHEEEYHSLIDQERAIRNLPPIDRSESKSQVERLAEKHGVDPSALAEWLESAKS